MTAAMEQQAAAVNDLPDDQRPSTSSDLQDAFKQWRTRKIKKQQELDPALALPRDHPERKAALRKLWLETAMKYVGVPYAQRFHSPQGCTCEGCTESGRDLHACREFLDCCGLVRKVARVLSRELGFRLGGGNQSYQFDTLPVRLESASQLQPGDLVFYSGTYFNPDARVHPFDMTHVEIFLGGETGEATIGSRERQKWVMAYPSYAFTSKRWALKEHFFISIDTWLEGVCTPAHPDMWKSCATAVVGGSSGGGAPAAPLAWDSKRFSIFSGEGGAGVEEDDEAADLD